MIEDARSLKARARAAGETRQRNVEFSECWSSKPLSRTLNIR